MQRLIYENVLGERVEMGGAPPFVLEHVSGVGATDTQIHFTRGARQNGVTTHGVLREKRLVRAQLALMGAQSREALYRLRQSLCRMLALARCRDEQTGQMGRLIYENDAGRYWAYAIPETPPSDGKRFAHALSGVTVTFQCDSPYWNEFEEHAQTLSMSDGGFSLPFSLPVRLGTTRFTATCENTGSISTPVRIVVEGAGEKPEIRNETTGAYLRIDRAVAGGERLEIDTDPQSLSVVITHADGRGENAFGYLDALCAVNAFALRPGRNCLRYVSGDTAGESRVRISWRARHEGV